MQFRLGAPRTIETHLANIRGLTSGFDYLRLILATGVLTMHSVVTVMGPSGVDFLWRSNWQGLWRTILPMFFALSGYLVAGSLGRTKLTEFVMLRVLRIGPALLVEVALSALLLGAIFTVVPWKVYFTSSLFWSYFLNIISDTHYYLPGVFLDNPYPGTVNGSLWTIPYELECYASLVILAMLTLTRRREWFLALVVTANVALAAAFYIHPPHNYWQYMPGRMLVICFLYGVVIHLYRDRIVLNAWLCTAAVVVMLALLSNPWSAYFAAFPAAYVTVSLGMTSPPREWLFGGADFSYGLYLFAFPIQQTYIHLFPQYPYWWASWLFTMFFGLLYAAFSWFVVEKPINDRKKKIIAKVEGVAIEPVRQRLGRLIALRKARQLRNSAR